MAVAFGKYQLLKKIGSGGMGQVFLARHAGAQGFEKLVVIKRILPHLVEEEEFLTMFFDEARIAARLNHPNLVQIFELGQANRSHYLAMEYVQGEDLRKLDRYARANGGLIPLGPALRIISDAAAGLDYAHKAKDTHGKPLGLIHRDVSPQNVLIGFDGAVKLIDFGVAKAAGRVQLTGTGVLKGKYPYMSPEQADGRELDPRSDVFALGIVLWEILTGRRLFKAESDLATMRLVLDCQVPPPSRVNPELPKRLDAVVLKALAKEPKDRFADAGAMRLAIEDLVMAERLSASSAHLQAYLAQLYEDRIDHESNLTNLDELEALDESEPGSKPSASSAQSRQNWREGQRPPSKSNIAAVSGSGSGGSKGGGQPARSPSGSVQAVSRQARPAIVMPVQDDEPTFDENALEQDVEDQVSTGGRTASLKDLPLPTRDVVGRRLWIGAGVLASLALVGAGVAVVKTQRPQPTPVVETQPVAPPQQVVASPTVTTPAVTPAATPTVRLLSDPPGATVTIDGATLGTTPLDYAVAQPVSAQLSLSGFESQTVAISAQNAPELTIHLAKKRQTTTRKPPNPLGIKNNR